MEEWRKVDALGNYEISNFGRIRSKACGGKWKILTPQVNLHGYLCIKIRDADGKRHHYPIHRLVAKAFVQNPLNKDEVRHKDGNTRNNCVYNLEWSTKSENLYHQYESGIRKPPKRSEEQIRKQNTANAKNARKLTEDQVLEILEDGARCVAAIARQYNVGTSTIHRIKSGKVYQEVYQKWKEVKNEKEI